MAIDKARNQELCLDAIEHSFSMADLAYNRMVAGCSSHSDIRRNHAIVLDAWSFVDVIKRLRSVLEHTPGLKNGAILRLFLDNTKIILDFRNHIQHIEGETNSLAVTGLPILGSFSWAKYHPDTKIINVETYVPGRIVKTIGSRGIPIVNPLGREFHGGIDHFEMTINDKTINLSDIFRMVEKFRPKFEEALKVALPKISNGALLIIDLDSVTSTNS